MVDLIILPLFMEPYWIPWFQIYGKGGSAVWDSEKGSCSEAPGGTA